MKNVLSLILSSLGVVLCFLSISFVPLNVYGQSQEEDEIEALFREQDRQAEKKLQRAQESTPQAIKVDEVEKLSELANLAPFSDIAVIQKRYLPKTGRFGSSFGVSTNLNDPFFLDLGINARLSYNFVEQWAVELIGFKLFTSEREVVKDLRDKNGVTTESLISTEAFYGVAVKWSPIYGKYSFLNNSITPFDMYFTAGAGVSSTNQDTSPTTLHLGVGQIAALSKSSALRVDLTWNFYEEESSVTGEKELTDNLYLSIAYSFFFPEAQYR